MCFATAEPSRRSAMDRSECAVSRDEVVSLTLAMIRLTQPWFLLLMPLVPLLVWCWLRQRRGALRYPHVGLLRDLPTGRSRLARWGGAGLRAAALVALIGALAGPRWPDLRTRIATEGVAIVMLVDVSGSMAERDFSWGEERLSRLE